MMQCFTLTANPSLHRDCQCPHTNPVPTQPCQVAAAIPSSLGEAQTLQQHHVGQPRCAHHTGFSPAARPTELLTLTPWLAPIVSEGTFDPELLQHIYQPLNLSIGVTVFAVGK